MKYSGSIKSLTYFPPCLYFITVAVLKKRIKKWDLGKHKCSGNFPPFPFKGNKANPQDFPFLSGAHLQGTTATTFSVKSVFPSQPSSKARVMLCSVCKLASLLLYRFALLEIRDWRPRGRREVSFPRSHYTCSLVGNRFLKCFNAGVVLPMWSSEAPGHLEGFHPRLFAISIKQKFFLSRQSKFCVRKR